MVLAKPSISAVIEAENKFDSTESWSERCLKHLFERSPDNKDIAEVYPKVLVLNRLYSTRLLDTHLEPMARHITGLGIDSDLVKGVPSVVDRIVNCAGLRKYYSFATKFCSWHYPTLYPIYDKNVDECLWYWKKQDKFHTFKRQDLGSFALLLAAVDRFRNFYGLGALTYKQLDKFLWLQGDLLLKEKAQRPVASDSTLQRQAKSAVTKDV